MLIEPVMVIGYGQNIVESSVCHLFAASLAMAQAKIIKCQAWVIMTFKFTDNFIYKVLHVVTSAFNNLLKFVLRTGPSLSLGPLAKR